MCVRIRYLSFSFWLTSFCIIGSRFIHIIRTDSNAFLLWLYIQASLCIPSVNGHLGYFRVLAIVNSVAVNIGVHVSFQFWFSRSICLVLGSLGNMVVLGFDPWVRKIPRRRERLPTPVFWSGEFHGLYSPQRVRQDWATFIFTYCIP